MIAQGHIFVDRRDAGFEVGKLLEEKYKDTGALVLGIPRGGVVVAYEIAKVLNAELSALITKKLPHPLQHELAIGASAEDGSVFLTALSDDIGHDVIHVIVNAQMKEIKRRIDRFRGGQPLPDMFNRTVIIADDGIATGSTIVPAIKLCKSRKAAKVIVAVPVSGAHYETEIDKLADEVVIAEQPDIFYAVGQVYADFGDVSDSEVIELLNDFRKDSNPK